MEHDEFPSEFSSDPARMVSFCPMCDAECNPMSAKVLEEFPGGTVVHVQCRNCQNAILAMMTQRANGIHSYGFLTDLSPEDYLRVSKVKPLTADDAIDAHVALSTGGEFSKALIEKI